MAETLLEVFQPKPIGCLHRITTYGNHYSRQSGLNKKSHLCDKEIFAAGKCLKHYKLQLKHSIHSAYKYAGRIRYLDGFADSYLSTIKSAEDTQTKLDALT